MNKVKSLILLLLVVSSAIMAYTPTESAKISILTASPGKEVYKIYGHTAIRFQDVKHRKDIVYNYGMFDFGAPNFILRYLQGQNFYLLGREPFKRFANRYEEGGEKVTEQTLNLTTEEIAILFAALEENAKPENREYLYNVFYDNCATRVYKIIETNLAGGVIWSEDCEEASFRELLHESNDVMPFSQLGIDIVFGTKADENTTCMEQMFLPGKLMKGLEHAHKNNNEALIGNTTVILEGREIHNKNEIFIFNFLFVLLLLAALYAHYKEPKAIRVLRIGLYSIAGILSLVVCFIAFFSIHPTVLPNPNLIWINPLWLFFAYISITQKEMKLIYQKILNIWAIAMSFYIVLGSMEYFYLHYGLLYIISILIIISYKKIKR